MNRFMSTLILVGLILSTSVLAFDPPTYFEKKCMSCHTVGKGDDVGPDLKDVHKKRDRAWLIRFIKESQSMIEEGDALANELFVKYKRKKMPDQELDDDEINELIAYIASGKVVDTSAKLKSALDSNPFDVRTGKELFSGTKRLKNGGPSCLSCHSAGDAGVLGGGTLGPDLSHAYSSYKDKGLSKVMKNINFPTMVEIYKKNKLTADEIYQIKSFLYSVDRQADVDNAAMKKFVFMGVVGFLLLLGFFDLVWRKRKTKTRRPQ